MCPVERRFYYLWHWTSGRMEKGSSIWTAMSSIERKTKPTKSIKLKLRAALGTASGTAARRGGADCMAAEAHSMWSCQKLLTCSGD